MVVRPFANRLRSWPLILGTILFLSLPAFCREKKEEDNRKCPTRSSEFGEIQNKARDNDPKAQTALASCYELGRNVSPSRAETIHWLTLAAEQDYAPAEYELGRIYLYGRGIPADFQQALFWEKKAADQGQSKAQRDLAFIYERGLGVHADPSEAAVWNRKAAEQGEAEAQLHLAEALDKGIGLPEDIAEAKQWYLKAAQHLSKAQLRIAQIYAQDDVQTCTGALRWYAKAAENGEAQAMYETGKLYQAGKCGGTPAKAFLWFQTGGRFGSAESAAAAEKLAPQLTAAQRKTIEAQIARWISKHSGAQKEEDEDEKEER